jgi:hypothetical protein
MRCEFDSRHCPLIQKRQIQTDYWTGENFLQHDACVDLCGRDSMLLNHRFDVGWNAAAKSVWRHETNLIAMKSETTLNHCAKKTNAANSSVKIRAPNDQSLSANGSRDALTHPMSRRAYHGLL